MKSNVYKRPDKPFRGIVPIYDSVPNRIINPDTPVKLPVIHASSECHVTPPDVSLRMAQYALEVSNADKVNLKFYEPEAGTGNLVKAFMRSGVKNIAATELNMQLYDHLGKHFDIELHHGCSLEMASIFLGNDRFFDGIVSNHPFRSIKKHVKAALSLLVPGGVYVSLVPDSFHLEGAQVMERLPRGTFITTNVSTKIIRFIN